MPLKREASLPADWADMLEGMSRQPYSSLEELEEALDEHLASHSPEGIRFSGANALKVLENQSWLRVEDGLVRLRLPSDQAGLKLVAAPRRRRGPLAE